MLTVDQFRALALAQPGAVEGAHMDHPDFRVNGRIFATLHPDGVRGMVVLTPEQQSRALRTACFAPANGAWGRQGCTLVTLADAERAAVADALTDAWQNAMSRPARASRSKAAAGTARKAAGRKSSKSATPRRSPRRGRRA